jgi:hypothetical protein
MAGDGSGTTKATAARRRRQRSVSTADNGAWYEDNGIGLYCRKTTAAADIDNDAISSSISLVRGSKQQSTDDRGEETAVIMSDCCLQGIEPCECKGKGYQWFGNRVFRLGSKKELRKE